MTASGTTTSQRIRFGLYELDLGARELRREGVVVKLQERPFAVLAILLERSGEVITREEFRRKLWPADTFVDFDASLNTSVNKLRQALKDNAENPRFILTAGRSGYRFIAPASQVKDEPGAASLAAPPQELKTAGWKSRPRTWLIAGAGIAALALATALTALLRPVFQPKVVNLTQITHDDLLDPWGKLTSDGARLFYLDRAGGRWMLMQAPASGGDAQPFSGLSRNTRVVDIAPDRAELLTFTFFGRSNDLPLWLTPVVGGPQRRVGNIVADDAVFSPNGQRIYFDRPDGIYSCALDGSQVERLVALPGRSEDPQWSKDGRRLRFTLDDPGTKTSSIWEVSAKGENLHRVNFNGPQLEAACCGRWSTDGRYFFFNATHDGIHSVWAIREEDGARMQRKLRPVQLTFGPESYGGLMTSEDPRRVYVWGGQEKFETARYDRTTGRLQPILPEIHATALTFSPDGAWVSYAMGGVLWRSRADGSEREPLVSGFAEIDQIKWAPNSKRILFLTGAGGESGKSYVVSVDGGQTTEIQLGRGDNEVSWSADSEDIVFARRIWEAHTTSGESGIFYFNLRTASLTKVPGSETPVHPSLSPDRRYLAAITKFELNPTRPTQVMLFDARTRRWNRIAQGTLVNPVEWSKDSRYFYYQDILAKDETAFRYSIATGKTDSFVDFRDLLNAGYARCSLLNFASDGELVMALRRNEVNIFRLDLDLP
jgi:Tol biopolymer transport system component/DNA-binding winged helix-turn-helix (wHTH) protein